MRIDGARLLRERERKALTLRELAELAGVTHGTVWRLENETSGTARPSTLRKIAGALGVEPEALIDWGGEGQTKRVRDHSRQD